MGAQQLTVQLRQGHTQATDTVAGVLRAHGATLRQQDPRATDEALAAFHLADVPEDVDMPALQEELLALDAVEAAYVKPPDAPP